MLTHQNAEKIRGLRGMSPGEPLADHRVVDRSPERAVCIRCGLRGAREELEAFECDPERLPPSVRALEE